jgi:hypothetical protein
MLLVAASPAAAQMGGGHSGFSTERIFTGRGAYDDLNAFGACYASKQTSDALKLLRTEAGSVDEANVYKVLFSKDQFCLGDLSGLGVPWKLVRGAIAEGMYARKMPLPAGFAAPRAMTREQVKSVMDAAICYVSQHPSDARALIETTKPGTKEEVAAVDAFEANFAACLPPNIPQQVQIDTILLRYRIAEAMWRLGMVHS